MENSMFITHGICTTLTMVMGSPYASDSSGENCPSPYSEIIDFTQKVEKLYYSKTMNGFLQQPLDPLVLPRRHLRLLGSSAAISE